MKFITESKKRSLAKAISWRITGSIDTFVISFIITREISYAIAISIVEVVTKICIYYFHERAWNMVAWGKPDHIQQNDELPKSISSLDYEPIPKEKNLSKVS